MYEYTFTLDRVVDGDTIDASVNLGFDVTTKQRIRLLGINAPETRTKDLDEKKKGLQAKEWLKQILDCDKALLIKTHKDKKGKFGRYLGYIYIDGDSISINEQMVSTGLAVIYEK